MQQWSPDGVRQERSGWRDLSLSQRHREWGFNCPAVDLDFLMVEYNIGKPVGLIEYKHHLGMVPDFRHPTYRALTELADIAGLPFIVSFYWPNIWAFRTTPVNEIARKAFVDGRIYTEREFVTELYRLRRFVLTEHLKSLLKDERPCAGMTYPLPSIDEGRWSTNSRESGPGDFRQIALL